MKTVGYIFHSRSTFLIMQNVSKKTVQKTKTHISLQENVFS